MFWTVSRVVKKLLNKSCKSEQKLYTSVIGASGLERVFDGFSIRISAFILLSCRIKAEFAVFTSRSGAVNPVKVPRRL